MHILFKNELIDAEQIDWWR